MPRPATTGPGFQAGDLIWSRNGENAWCTIFSILSLTSWSYWYITAAGAGVVASGPQALDLFKPDHHRRRELLPPRP